MILSDLFSDHQIPLEKWVQDATNWIGENGRPVFQVIRWPVDRLLDWLTQGLEGLPPLVFLAILFLLVWRLARLRLAILSVVAFLFIGFIGQWDYTMVTIAMVLTALLLCVVIGVPLGVAAGSNRKVDAFLRPVLDIMQTAPTFVYLIPIVMLFGIGAVPGVIATIIFAIPPIIRLTSLGIRTVQPEVVEAGYAFGSSRWQVLREIQMPLALPTIMAGVNQTLMLALSMVVVVSLIGAGGLGFQVLTGINQLDVGLGATAGLSIILLAMVLDRTSQSRLGRAPGARRDG